VAVLMSQKRRHSTWIRSYLRRRHQESVYYSLLPDLAELHPEKFRQFFAHGIWDIWGVVSTHWTSNTGGLLLVCPRVSFAKFHTSDYSWRLVMRKLATRRTILIWRFFKNSFKSTFKRNFILLTNVKTIIESR